MNETPGLRRLEHAIADAYSQGPLGILDAVRRCLHDRDEHVLTVHEPPSHDDPTAPGGFVIEHTLDCRIQGLDRCRYHEWASRHPWNAPGRYLLTLDGSGAMQVTVLVDDAVGLTPRRDPPLGRPRAS